jgi:hypothetical protein
MAGSNSFTPRLFWEKLLSSMFFRESCSIGSKVKGVRGGSSRPSNLKGQSLQDRGFLVAGAIK